jgi:23S rRNA (cytosine1962-C5)-methyltransferase
MATVTLKPDRERSVLLRHPWVFSGAIGRVTGRPADGEAVDVLADDGRWLARGAWSGQSQIQVRLWTWEPDETIDAALIRRRLARALQGRAALAADPTTTAYRLVFSEADQLPGVVVARYGDYLVVQLSTAGAAARAGEIAAALAEAVAPRGIVERSEAEVRVREGLPPAAGLLWGDEPPDPVEIRARRFLVNLTSGQKTGAYLDQRANRRSVAAYCRDAEVLSCFCYTGGFELPAALAGARRITAIDSSAEALGLAALNQQRNGITTAIDWVEGNVFGELRRLRAEERRFDVVILDPPKFVTAPNSTAAVAATRHHRWRPTLRPGGVLATFSCSAWSQPISSEVVFGGDRCPAMSDHRPPRPGRRPPHPARPRVGYSRACSAASGR